MYEELQPPSPLVVERTARKAGIQPVGMDACGQPVYVGNVVLDSFNDPHRVIGANRLNTGELTFVTSNKQQLLQRLSELFPNPSYIREGDEEDVEAETGQ